MKFFLLLLWGIIACVIGTFFALITVSTVNIPQGDDLYCLLNFTQDFQDTAAFSERFRLLTEQWVEHRIFFSRFSALLSYWLHGKVNFVTITLIGNAFLLTLTFMFRTQLAMLGLKHPVYLLPVVFALFNPVTYEANVWAGAATVYMPVCFFGLLVPFLLARTGRGWFVAAILTAIVATLSFGNGMFAFLSGLLVLVYRGRFKHAALWIVVAFLSVSGYFYGLEMHSATKSFGGMEVHFQHPEYLLYNLLVFVGGMFSYVDNTNQHFRIDNVPALLMGALLLGIIAWGALNILFHKATMFPERARLAWLGMASFVCITAAAMSYSRTFGQSMNTVSSRYRIYSMVFFILAYLWCLMYFQRKKPVAVLYGISGFLLLVFSYFVNYEHLATSHTTLRAGLYNYIQNHDWLIYRHTAYYAPASVAVSDSISRKKDSVFDFRQPFPQLTQAALLQADTLPGVTILPLDNCYGKPGSCISLSSDAFPAVPNVHKGVYIVVYNASDIYLFPASPLKNGRMNMLKTGNYFKEGFSALVDYGSALPQPADYQLAVFCPSLRSGQLRRISRHL
ncbi:hypothetical protein [Dyadobacter sandarakinus]|uniref:Glucosyl transferase GtrII n=1 Tax=Dyadobacter sandarakinus TaxID=2747268 RepID=A0ABX7IE38_9BACT|nr:hypothetical protein [Dyadobacter sandarakinus]QRR03687.1 hypothetical protein HWI92_23605 [Dyadobacter sandarakinus]